MSWTCNPDRVEGIDVSGWQTEIDFREVAAEQKKFVIVKGAEGTSATRRRDQHMAGATAAGGGLMTGLYYFGRPDSYRHLGLDDAKREASVAARIWRDCDALWDVEIGPILDFERGDPSDEYNALWALEWLQTAHDLTGRLPWIYSARWAVSSYFRRAPAELAGRLARYPLWWADYQSVNGEGAEPEDETTPWPFWTIWQYTGRGTCPGVAGNCDLNVMRGDAYDALLCESFDAEYRGLVP